MADDPLCASGPPDLNKHLMCLPVLRSRNSWRENSAASRHRQSFASRLLYHCISRGSTRLIRKERAQGHLRETNEFVRFERRSKTRNRSWIFVDGSVRANFLLEKMRSLSSSGVQKRVDETSSRISSEFPNRDRSISIYQMSWKSSRIVSNTNLSKVRLDTSSKQGSLLRDFHTEND